MKSKSYYNFIFWASCVFPFFLNLLLFVEVDYAPNFESINKDIKSHLIKMKYIEGGSFIMGMMSSFDVRMTKTDSTLLTPGIPKRKDVESFYISATEVTNKEWHKFYQDQINELGEEMAKSRYFPDTSLWIKEFPYSYNKPMARNYFAHSSFENYPVVGITWEQANAYCRWKSDKVNALLGQKGIQTVVDFRLPTELEWEYAAMKKEKKAKKEEKEIFTKRSFYIWAKDVGIGQVNSLTNIGQIRNVNNAILKQYVDDGCLYTCEVASYPATELGLYDMAGNVSEWTSERAYVESYNIEMSKNIRMETLAEIEKEIVRLQTESNAGKQEAKRLLDWMIHNKAVMSDNNSKICKGGSWANGILYAQPGSRQAVNKDQASTKLGFRIAVSIEDKKVQKYFSKKKWKPGK